MFDNLDIFRMAQGFATHSAARQATIAENIANADTPGYRARDLMPFAEAYKAEPAAFRATRGRHDLGGTTANTDLSALAMERPGAASPNGNTVSLEAEMFTAAEVKSHHDRALAIYKSALNIVRTSVNGGK